MNSAQLREQSTRRLDCVAAELDRIEIAVVAAARGGIRLPSTDEIFGALTDASMASAAVIDAHGAKPIPPDVRTGLLRLHCSVTDLVTSLGLYSALAIPLSPRFSMTPERRPDPSLLH
jgi:hypothetical protein